MREGDKAARLVERYLEERSPAWSKRTLDHNRNALALFLRSLAGEGCGLTRRVILGFVLEVEGFRRKRDGRPWAARSKHWPLLALRGLLEWALLRGELLEDLASLIVVKSVETAPRALGEEQVRQTIESGCTGAFAARDRAILELFYGTGLRASELKRLEVGDVGLSERLLHVREGKGRKDRLVPFGERPCQALLAYLRQRPARQGALFLSRYERPLSVVMLWRIVKRAGRRAGVESVSPHRLRHSYATHLLRHGAPLPALKLLLGHASLASTQVYLKVEVSDLARMIERSHPRERESKPSFDAPAE